METKTKTFIENHVIFQRVVTLGSHGSTVPEPARLPVDNKERARRYIAKIPGAVSGHDGHGQTLRVACVLVHGFALNEATALDLVLEWNATCSPEWSRKELEHKISETAKVTHQKPRGHLLGPEASPMPSHVGRRLGLIKATGWRPPKRESNTPCPPRAEVLCPDVHSIPELSPDPPPPYFDRIIVGHGLPVEYRQSEYGEHYLKGGIYYFRPLNRAIRQDVQ